MNANDQRISLLAARYLDALERDDHAALDSLWQMALTDADLLAAFQEIHDGLLEEEAQEDQAAIATIAKVVEQHLTGGQIIRDATGPVTVGDVATEIFHRTPDRLPAEAHAMNERLRESSATLPANLGLSALQAWCESQFGPAPVEYWKAFRQAAIKLGLQRAAETEYQLAARSAPRPENKS